MQKESSKVLLLMYCLLICFVIDNKSLEFDFVNDENINLSNIYLIEDIESAIL